MTSSLLGSRPFLLGALVLVGVACGEELAAPVDEGGGASAAPNGGEVIDASSPSVDGATDAPHAKDAKDAKDATTNPGPGRAFGMLYRTACATTATGITKCWGSGAVGQLGTGNRTSSSVPVATLAPPNTRSLAGGNNHACALSALGGVTCWGHGEYGQLGDGLLTGPTGNPTPVTPTGLGSGVLALASSGMGQHMCAIVATGVKCWGSNDVGQIGDGATGPAKNDDTPAAVPTTVVGLGAGVRAVSIGNMSTCAIDAASSLSCWGSSYLGVLGHLPYDQNKHGSPVAVPAVGAVDAVSIGAFSACAVTSGGAVKCWGFNENNELGLGTASPPKEPGDSAIASGALDVSVGLTHACALMKDGTIQCWGGNDAGQLGLGDLTPRSSPTKVPGLSNVRQIIAGADGTCAVLATGAVQCWGADVEAKLGNGLPVQNSSVPVSVVGL